MPLPDPWSEFAQDPRLPEHAGLRAADSDRDVALGVLAQAYAEGRLDREEYDQRSAAVQGSRMMGELAPLLDDLVAPVAARSRADLVPTAPDSVRAQAVQRWERDRREALMGFLAPTLITWVIWAVVMLGEFPWPAIVTVATAIPLITTIVRREDILASHEKRIEKKAAKRQTRELDGPDPDVSEGP